MTDEPETEDETQEPASPNPSAATRKGVKAAVDKSKDHEAQVAEFWRAVMRDKVGRAEMWRILKGGGLFTPPFAVGPNGFPQPEATWFKAGQHSLVQGEYHRLWRIDPEGVRLMLIDNDPAWKKPE